MKILELAPYVFVEGHSYAGRNQSGLAYMIRSICDMLSLTHEVRVITQSVLTTEQKVGYWSFIKRNYLTILSYLKLFYLRCAFKFWKQDKSQSIIRCLLYWCSAGQAENCIRGWHPDVVHIHGIGYHTIPFLVAAARCEVPVVVTLHGLISFSDAVKCSDYLKSFERRFLRMCTEENVSLIFISTGMKKRIVDLLNTSCENISVIPNCYRPSEVETVLNEKKFTREWKTIICVGGLSKLKNHIQVIRILPELRKQYGHDISLEIIGDGPLKEELLRYVEGNGINNVRLCGRLSQHDVYDHLAKADLLVFPSLEEGFGIPMIEAYSLGVPVVTFKDLDASDDVYNECSTIFAEDRSDEALIKAVLNALNKAWDSEAIIEWSKSFRMNAVQVMYNEVMNRKHNPLKLNRLLNVIKGE